jgi:hypothetical protein
MEDYKIKIRKLKMEITNEEIIKALSYYGYNGSIDITLKDCEEREYEAIKYLKHHTISKINMTDIQILKEMINITMKKCVAQGETKLDKIINIMGNMKLEESDEKMNLTSGEMVNIPRGGYKKSIGNIEIKGEELIYSMYVGYVGKFDEKYVFKYGYTKDINKRTNSHKCTYGKIDMVYHNYFIPKMIMYEHYDEHWIEIYKTEIEDHIDKKLQELNIMKLPFMNGGRRLELFAITDLNKLKEIIPIIQKIMDDCENSYIYKLKSQYKKYKNYSESLERKIGNIMMKDDDKYKRINKINEKIDKILLECDKNSNNIELINALEIYAKSTEDMEEKLKKMEAEHKKDHNELAKVNDNLAEDNERMSVEISVLKIEIEELCKMLDMAKKEQQKKSSSSKSSSSKSSSSKSSSSKSLSKTTSLKKSSEKRGRPKKHVDDDKELLLD